MTRKKSFDLRAILNRNRVRRYRLKKQLENDRFEERNIYQEFQKSINDRINDRTNVPLRDKLKMWACDYRITSRAINNLLKILIGSGKY